MTFTASSLADPDGGSIIAVEWSFGDGATASGTSVSHAYSTPGQKTVTMTITDSSGETTQVSHTLRVNAPPTASFTVAPSVPTSGSKVTFSASGSSDPDGSIASYAWEVYQRQFDGTYPSSPTFTRAGVSFDNTFYIPGLYKVRLSVTDSDGEAAATERVVRVNSFAFEINFFWEPPSPLVGEEVTFTGVALDAPDDAPIPFTGYRWDLDNDGRFGEGPGQVPGSTLGEIGVS